MAAAADAWGPRRTQPLRSNSTSSPIPWMPLPPMPGLLELPPMPPLLPLGAAHGMGLLAPLQASLPLPSLPSPLNSPGFTDIAVQQGFAQHSGAALAWNATSSPPHVPSVAPSAEQQPPLQRQEARGSAPRGRDTFSQSAQAHGDPVEWQNAQNQTVEITKSWLVDWLRELKEARSQPAAVSARLPEDAAAPGDALPLQAHRTSRSKRLKGYEGLTANHDAPPPASRATVAMSPMSPASALHMRPAEAQRLRAAADVTAAFTTTSQGLLCSDMHRVHLDNGWQRFREEQMGVAKPLQLDGAVQWLRESAARAKERRKTTLCGPAHMWLLNQFDREVQAATCIQRAWRAYHQRVAGMSDEERKKMELRFRSQCARVAKALQGDRVTGVVAEFLAAITFGVGQTIESCAHKQGETSSHPASLPPAPETPPADFSTLSPMEKVRWTALSMTSYADKRRDVRLNTKEARKRLESGQEMLQGLLSKDLDLLKEVLLAKGEGAAGGSGSGAAARHASISKLVQKKVAEMADKAYSVLCQQQEAAKQQPSHPSPSSASIMAAVPAVTTAAARRGSIATSSWVLGVDMPGRASRTTHPGLGHGRDGARTSLPAAVLAALTANDALTIAPVAGALRNSDAATGASAGAADQLDPDSAAAATHAATFARARGKSDTLSAQYSQSVSRLSYAEPGSGGSSRRNSSAVVAAAMAVRLSQTHRMEPPRTMRLSYTAGPGGGSLLSFDECGGLVAAGTRLSVGAVGAGAESALAPGAGALAPGASELVVPEAARASWTAGFGAATAPSRSGSVAGAPIVGAAALAALLGLGPLIPLPALAQAPGCEQDGTHSIDPEGGSDRIASVLAPSRDTSQVQPEGCRPASADAAPDFADPHKGKAVGTREAAARKLGGSARAGVARTGGSSRHAGTAQGVSPGYMLPQRQAKGGLPTALPKPPGMRVTPAPPTSPAPGARVRKPQRIVCCKGGAKAHVDRQAASRKAVAPGGSCPDPAVDSGEPSPPSTEASSSSGAGDRRGATRWPRIPSSIPAAQEQRPCGTATEPAPPQTLTNDVSLAVWATAAAAVATTISDAASPAAGDSLPYSTAGVSLGEGSNAPLGITVAKASSNKALRRCTAGNTATSGSGGGGMAGGGAAAVPSGGVWDSPVSATGSLLPAFWGPGGELEDAEGPHAAASSPVTPGLRPLVIKHCWDEQGAHAPDATPASPAAAVASPAASIAQALSPGTEDAMAVEGTVSNSPSLTSAAAGSTRPAMLLAVPQPPASLPSAPSSPRGRPAANHSPASPFGTAQPDSPKASGSPSAFGTGLLHSSSGLSPLASRHLPRPTPAPHHMGGPFHAQASALAAQALTPPVAFSGAPLMTQVPLGSAATSIRPAGSNNAIASPFIGLSIKTRLAGAGAGASQKQGLASPTKSSPSPLQLGSPAGLALATAQSQGLGPLMPRLAPAGPALQLQQPSSPLSRLGGGVGGTAFSPAGEPSPAAPSHLGAGGKPVRLPLAIKITGSGLGGAAGTVAGGGGSSSAPCSPTHHRTSGALTGTASGTASGVGCGSGTLSTEGTVFGPDRPGTPLPSSLQNILSQGRVQLQNPVHRLAIVGEQHVLNAHPGNSSGSSNGSGGSQFRVREGSRGSRSGPVSWSEPGHGDPETQAAIASALMVAGTRQVPQLHVQGQGQVQLLPPLQPGATAVGSRSRVKPQVVRGLGQEGSGGGSKGDLRIKASAALVTATLGSDRFATAALPEEAALLGMADRAPSASTAPEQEQRCTGPQRRGLQVHITWASSSAPCSPGPPSAELLPLPPLEWETPGDSAGQDEDGGTAGGEQLEGLQEELLVPPDRITLAGWRR